MRRWLKMIVAVATCVVLVTGVTSAVASPPGSPEPRGKGSKKAPPLERQPTLEAVYVPIRPCRIVDTRSTTVGKVAPGSTRLFRVRGTSSFSAQGGTDGGCGVPTSATGVTVNTTMTSVTDGGYLSNYPVGKTVSTSNFTTFAVGQSITSNPTFALAATGLEPSLAIKASGAANTHLIIDVTGYFAPQVQGMVMPSGDLYSGTPALVSSLRLGPGDYQVTVDRDVSFCAVSAHAFSANFEAYATGFTGSNFYVYVISRAGGTVTYVDDYVYVQATC